MATFVLIHGAGDVGWYWHLVEAELRARGHDVVAPDRLDTYLGQLARD
jgi:pimeloyl-ACP methyl ester carboxylesterase